MTRDINPVSMREAHPNQILRWVFAERRAKNPSYSTRALARDLGMSQALVSLLMNDKRRLTAKQAARLSALLAFSSEETQTLMNQVLGNTESKGNIKPKKVIQLSIDRFHAIAHWYHLAILDLTTTKNYKPDPKSIANRLGITPIEVRDALDRLERIGLLIKKGSTFVKANRFINFLPEKSELAVRTHHREMMERASLAMNDASQDAYSKRTITSNTLAISASKVKEAKALVHEFRERFVELVSKGVGDEVYQMNIQFFPLTVSNKGETKRKF
ncbi:MAG: TIGR02147 family protein [Xanthomonadaceae bacterium]|nr:TIGR02147 family protein [Xanthomonadaceae bacterium]